MFRLLFLCLCNKFTQAHIVRLALVAPCTSHYPTTDFMFDIDSPEKCTEQLARDVWNKCRFFFNQPVRCSSVLSEENDNEERVYYYYPGNSILEQLDSYGHLEYFAKYRSTWMNARRQITPYTDKMTGGDYLEWYKKSTQPYPIKRFLLGSGVSGPEACRTRHDNSGIDWDVILQAVYSIIDHGECLPGTMDLIWRASRGHFIDIGPYVGWSSDCFFGEYSIRMAHLICTEQSLQFNEESLQLMFWTWLKVILDTEAFLFLFRTPIGLVYTSYWPLIKLWQLVHKAMTRSFGDKQPNACDEIMTAEQKLFLQKVLQAGSEEKISLAWEFLKENDLLAERITQVGSREDGVRVCLFGYAITPLILTNRCTNFGNGSNDDGRCEFSQLDASTFQTIPEAFSILSSWELFAHPNQFYFDLFTSKWPFFDLLPIQERPTFLPQAPINATKLEYAYHPDDEDQDRVSQGIKVLFVGGGNTTYMWSSFSVRARQMARALRNFHGVDAMVYSSNCESYCITRKGLEDTYTPDIIVHLKSLCSCAVAGMNITNTCTSCIEKGLPEIVDSSYGNIAHVLDPIDNFDIESDIKHVDALLLQTHKAVSMYTNFSEHVKVYLLPHHHSNFAGFRSNEMNHDKLVVGVHSVHDDPNFKIIEEYINTNFKDIEFRRHNLDYFKETMHQTVTPHHAEIVHEEISQFGIGIVHAGCNVTSNKLCRDLKNGQRLTNMLATGVPAIAWNSITGHREILEGTDYPMVANIDEALQLLRHLILDAGYRQFLRMKGLEIAEKYKIEIIAGRFKNILHDVAARKHITACNT